MNRKQRRGMTGKLPTCGTCPFALPSGAAETLWCHGGPPSALRSMISRLAPDNTPLPPELTRHSDYPPVGADDVGCGWHPDWPRPTRRWWRWW